MPRKRQRQKSRQQPTITSQPTTPPPSDTEDVPMCSRPPSPRVESAPTQSEHLQTSPFLFSLLFISFRRLGHCGGKPLRCEECSFYVSMRTCMQKSVYLDLPLTHWLLIMNLLDTIFVPFHVVLDRVFSVAQLVVPDKEFRQCLTEDGYPSPTCKTSKYCTAHDDDLHHYKCEPDENLVVKYSSYDVLIPASYAVVTEIPCDYTFNEETFEETMTMDIDTILEVGLQPSSQVNKLGTDKDIANVFKRPEPAMIDISIQTDQLPDSATTPAIVPASCDVPSCKHATGRDKDNSPRDNVALSKELPFHPRYKLSETYRRRRNAKRYRKRVSYQIRELTDKVEKLTNLVTTLVKKR